MGQVNESLADSGIYERLLQRLATALDEAENLATVVQQPQQDLELRDVTPSEMRLIRAYLERERSRLGHVQSSTEAPLQRTPRTTAVLVPEGLACAYAEQAEAPATRCTLCGATRHWQPSQGVQLCQGCGSQLFKQRDHR
jgi:rRNA maturation endonuclease Nob1